MPTAAKPGAGPSGFFESSALAYGSEPVEAFNERFSDAIRRVERAQMDGTIEVSDGLMSSRSHVPASAVVPTYQKPGSPREAERPQPPVRAVHQE
jgi:hypothetical protein